VLKAQLEMYFPKCLLSGFLTLQAAAGFEQKHSASGKSSGTGSANQYLHTPDAQVTNEVPNFSRLPVFLTVSIIDGSPQ
jgi:hypothetical protein